MRELEFRILGPLEVMAGGDPVPLGGRRGRVVLAERAATLAGASEGPFDQIVTEADRPVFERIFARFLAPARTALGASGWMRAHAAGEALALEAVFELALEDDVSVSGAATRPRRR